MKKTALVITMFSLIIGLFAVPQIVSAQECFIGEIRMFGGNFAPRSWALCNGQLLPISTNTALFSILGTMYGGDGRTTFGLPDLRGRFAMSAGFGPGLSPRTMGQKAGTETVTLTTNQMPSHTHPDHIHDLMGSPHTADSTSPEEKLPGTPSRSRLYSDSVEPVDCDDSPRPACCNDSPPSCPENVMMDTEAISPAGTPAAGQGQSHNNMPPFQVVNYIICLQGIYPSRN